MKFSNIHNIPMRIRLGCLGLFIALIFITVVLLVGFFQVFAFLIDTWIGIILLISLCLYILLKKIIPKFNSSKDSLNTNNNFTEADYIEIEDDEEQKR